MSREKIAGWRMTRRMVGDIIPRMAKQLSPSLRQLVATNLRALMRHARDTGNKDLSSPFGLERLTGVSDDVVRRILDGSRAADLDQLEALAAAFQLQPWELLYLDLKPDAPPSGIWEAVLEMLADRIEAEETALARLTGRHGNRRDKAGRDGAGDAPNAPQTRKPEHKS
jgi:hypothetical protein